MKLYSHMEIKGNIVDPVIEKIYKGLIIIENGKIIKIVKNNNITETQYILPGFINSHVHIESSMLTPVEFSKQAIRWGTVAVVTDPHEIANVLGVDGIKFMLANSKHSLMKFYFGAPSCVPATKFETSGAIINSMDILKLLKQEDIFFLSEMMNYPGVVFNDKEVHKKLHYAKMINKPIDGHAPGLSSKDLELYAKAGITTDHECTTIEEAKEKIALGIKIQIREGSAAKDFEALYPLIDMYPDKIMLCTDDSHPDDLMEGHINLLVKKALKKGLNIFNILKAVNLNPKEHYDLNVGSLQKNDVADFIIVDNLEDFFVLKTFINGKEVFDGNLVKINYIEKSTPNNFNTKKISEDQIKVKDYKKKIKVIECKDGDLLTKQLIKTPKVLEGEIITDIDNDILKIVVYNRYKHSEPIVGFITGFGLKTGAIASSIAHDSHNIIALGTNDKDIVNTINKIVDNKGGIAVFDGFSITDLKLEVAGLMSNSPIQKVAERYKLINSITVNKLGSNLKAPFMTLSFMALLVIPELKIGDQSLFDGNKFIPTSLYYDGY